MSTKTPWLVVFVMLAVIAGQGAAGAASPTMSLDPATGPPTTPVAVSGAGFQPEEAVSLSFGTKARGTVSADQAGAFSATIKVPRSAGAGGQDVTATGETSSLEARATFTVVLPSIALEKTEGPPMLDVILTGADFRGLESVEVAFDEKVVGRATADQTGAFSTILSVPSGASSGTHDVAATGGTSGLIAREVFTVRIDKWPQYGFDPAHSGTNQHEGILSPATVGDLVPAWTTRVDHAGELATGFSSPAVVKGVVYIGSEDGTVHAIDAWTGEALWSTDTGDTHNWSSPAVAKGVVYIGGLGLYALHASDGTILWSVDTHADLWSPTVAGGMVYGLTRTGTLASKGGKFYAIRASDGEIVWTLKTGYPGDSSTAQAPTVADGVVYIGSATNDLYALDADTGQVRWTFSMGEEAGVAPAVVDGVVYAPSVGHLQALDASTADVLWTATVEGGMSSPAVRNGVVFLGGAHDFHAFDAATGTLIWSAPLGYGTGSSPAAANGVVYALGQTGNVNELGGSVYALDAISGEILWRALVGSSSQPDPRVVNGMVYVGSEDGNVYAFALP